MKVRIQKPDPIHLPAAAKLHATTFQEIGESINSGKEIVGDKRDDQFTVVALRGEKIAGYAIAYGRSTITYFGWLGVDKKFRNAGIAALLAKNIETWSKRNKSKAIMLDTRNRYKSAIRLYLRLGYDIVGTWTNHDGEIMIRLRKDL